MSLQVLTIIRDARRTAVRHVAHSEGQSHLGMPSVMTVGFAVRGDVNDLGMAAVVPERAEQTARESLAALQQVFKRQRARNWTVVYERCQLGSRTQPDHIGHT